MRQGDIADVEVFFFSLSFFMKNSIIFWAVCASARDHFNFHLKKSIIGILSCVKISFHS